MLPTEPEGYVSVIGSSYLFPLTVLLEELESLATQGPNEVQTSPRDNGISVAIVAIAVLFIESAISRTQYMRGDTPPAKPLVFLRNIYPESGFCERIEELFVIRDVIVHNHIWEAEISWDIDLGMKLRSAGILEGYGDKKFKKVLDPKSRRTCLLGLNVFPTRICRADAIKVLKEMIEFMLFLQKEDSNYIHISPEYVKYAGKMRDFAEIVSEL